MEWWQRFNLKSNPLEKTGNPYTGTIDYIVETPLYNKYFDRFNYIDSFFKIFSVICGEYGSGKTTFFEFLKNKAGLLNLNIESIDIKASTFSDSGQEIFDLIKTSLHDKISDNQKGSIELVDISNALTIRCQEKKLYGHLVFIDELHHNSNLDAIFEFFKLSQGMKEYLFNYHNIGFFIAGHTYWLERLQNPTYSGPIDSTEIMDEIDSSQSFDIITKRISEFVINPMNKNQKFIEKEAIEKIYATLHPLTPRQLIIDTREAFERLPETKMILTSADISKKVNHQTIDAIRRVIISTPLAHRKLNSILNNYSDNDKKRNAFRFLSRLYEKISIDNDNLKEFLEEMGLKDASIIVDLESWEIIQRNTFKTIQKGSYGSMTIAKDVLQVNSLLNSIFNNINEKHKISPGDYLERVYIPEKSKVFERKTSLKEKYISTEDEILDKISEVLSKHRLSMGVKYIQVCREEYRRIYKFLETPTVHIDPPDIPNKCERSLNNLINAYFVFEQSDNDAFLQDENLLEFAITLIVSEDLNNFYHEIRSIAMDGGSIDRNLANYIARQYIQTIKEVLPEIEEEMRLGNRFPLNPAVLTKKDMMKFREIRNILHRDYEIKPTIERARNELIKHFEKRMRDLIAGCLNIQYGEGWVHNREILDDFIWKGIQKSIYKQKKSKSDFKPSENLLTYSDQTHLRELIIKNWKHCFSPIFQGTPDKNDSQRDMVKNFWKEIYTERINDAHYQESMGSHVQEVFNKCVELIQWLNQYIQLFLTEEKAVIRSKDDLFSVYFKDPKLCNCETLTINDVKSIWNTIKGNEEVTIKFYQLPPSYTKAGRKYLAVLRYLLKCGCINISGITVNEMTLNIDKDYFPDNKPI